MPLQYHPQGPSSKGVGTCILKNWVSAVTALPFSDLVASGEERAGSDSSTMQTVTTPLCCAVWEVNVWYSVGFLGNHVWYVLFHLCLSLACPSTSPHPHSILLPLPTLTLPPPSPASSTKQVQLTDRDGVIHKLNGLLHTSLTWSRHELPWSWTTHL